MVKSFRKHFLYYFSFLSIIAAFLSYHYAGKVFSLVNLTISKDRQQVLEQAQDVASNLGWNLDGYQSAVVFQSEEELQCFVELEGGGKQAFTQMFQSGIYEPFHWAVRFFKPQEVAEMFVWFSPQGKKLGFYQKLSELDQGSALSKEKAQDLIEKEINNWCPDFEKYSLIEYDYEVQTTGRVDHDFVYERTDLMIGKGLYRFKAHVAGDIITRLEPFVKIPDSFVRRYKEMRSFNILLASIGQFALRFLYFVCFVLLGLIFFYRRKYLLIKPSIYAATVIAGGMFLRAINDYPLWWFSYNTVQSSMSFLVMQLVQEIISFIVLFLIVFLGVVVAEAAGRFVYKNHVQFFSIFSSPVVHSLPIAKQILYGYLCVPFMFAFVIGFEFIMKHYFGWWVPAASFYDPNVIASYFPCISTLTISLYAGFTEEVIFRALPLAMILVLTANNKNKNFWFWFIFILQALIFGACHANYPNQPAYARIVELIVPSFGFGYVYLLFGLLPGIITHFVYDAILFSMPIFISNLFWTKIFAVFLIGLPFWMICFWYLWYKKFDLLSEKYFNQASQAFYVIEKTLVDRPVGKHISKNVSYMIYGLGFLGFCVFAYFYQFDTDTYPLLIKKEQAIQIARHTVEQKFGASLGQEWTVLTQVEDDCNQQESRFVWQKYGQEIYDLACGSYLSGVYWVVRFVKFHDAVENRAEEYRVVVSSAHIDSHHHSCPIVGCAGHVIQALHILPEHFAGNELSQDQATLLVQDFIAQEYLLQEDDVKIISVDSDKFDNRRDWTFVLQDVQIFDFGLGGQARIKVKIAGDQLAGYKRFIFVPEDWQRQDQAFMLNISLIKTGLFFLMILFMTLGLTFGLYRLMRSRLGLQMLQHKAGLLAVILIIYSLNNLPVILSSFNTSEPFSDQIMRISLTLMSTWIWQILLGSIFFAIGAIGFVRGVKTNFIQALLLSGSIGALIVGVGSIVNLFEPKLQPIAGMYGPASHWISTVGFIALNLKSFYLILSLFIALFAVLEEFKMRWNMHWFMQLLVTILCSISFESMQPIAPLSWMLMHGLIVGCIVFFVYYFVLQCDMTLLPLVFGMSIVLKIIPEIIYPSYVGAQLDAIFAIIFVIAMALFFYERAHQE
ncbi:MAG: CPBP family intramembrane glutamic endopeptidase [Candidatus Chromulinivorax sp.]